YKKSREEMWTAKEKRAARSLIDSCFDFHNRNGRHISVLFEELPDKSNPQNSAYYDKVPDPRSLRQVSEYLKKGSYDSPKDFYTDLKMVFSNLSFVVNKSARDWQDAIRMDQYVDEAWELKSAAGELPSLDNLFGDESDSNQQTLPQNEVSNTTIEQVAPSAPDSGADSATMSNKRIRSQSTSSSASGEAGYHLPGSNSSNLNGIPRGSSNKRPRRATQSNVNGEEDSAAQLKDRFPDSDTGWMRDNPNHDSQTLTRFILNRLKSERIPITSSLPNSTTPVEMLSSTTIAQDLPLLNLDRIETRLSSNDYSDAEAFDKDLYQAFLEAEKIYACDPDRLGLLYVLKRLYQELTQNDGSAALKDSIPIGTAKKLASVSMGPGNKSQLPKNDEPVKLKAKEKVLLEGIHLKGDYFRVGDCVHIFNPEDPSRPIIAQIFNTYRRVDTGRRAINVCWYYRPEDTVHQISRIFFKDEVFKTGNFIDHLVEDVIGRCLVLFYTRYLKGRPSAPIWAPNMPTYICEHRYKDDVYGFKKIKNWESCVPSNVRNEATEENFVPYPTPLQVSSLVKLKSPFLKPPDQALRASGEAIYLGHTEVAKSIPKDQFKSHDLCLTIEAIEKIVGKIPDTPVRAPHVIEISQENSSNTPTARSSQSGAHRSSKVTPKLPTSALPPAPITAISLPKNLIGNLGGTNAGNGENSSDVSQRLKNIDFKSKNLVEMLGQKDLRRDPCLLDLYSNQEYFEKLPDELFGEFYFFL
ncbi:hypothetical protein BY996DRAFT_4575204, partial [Phakopsora pachyrhizi]